MKKFIVNLYLEMFFSHFLFEKYTFKLTALIVLQTSVALCRGLALAGNKGPRSGSIIPPPAVVGRKIGRKTQSS